jgi:hypothetical protein
MTVAEEAQRYLEVVEFFRAEGREPHWRREDWLEQAQLNSTPPSPLPENLERRKECPN